MPEIVVSELDERNLKRFENANLAIDRGNYEYAIDLCLELLAAHPGLLEARMLLRRAQQSRYTARLGVVGRIANGIACSLHTSRGRSLLRKNPAGAAYSGEKALSRNPFHQGALLLVADACSRLGLERSAGFCLSSVVERAPRDAGVLFRYCEALIKTGETEKALVVAERLSRLKSGDVRVQELMKAVSVAHSIQKGKWSDAEGSFRSKLRDEEEAESLEQSNRIQRNMAVEERRLRDIVAKKSEDLDARRELAKLVGRSDDLDAALEEIDKALALPQLEKDIELLQLRSEVKLRRVEAHLADAVRAGDAARVATLEDELRCLRVDGAARIVEQFPNDYGQRMAYGALLLEVGRIDDAIQQFQVSQRSPNLKGKSLVLLGKCFMEKGLYDLALEQFELAQKGSLNMDENRKDIIYQAATCCELLGRRGDAILRYKQIYANDISFRDVAEKIDSFYSRGDAS